MEWSMSGLEPKAEELFVGSYHHSLDSKRRLIIPSAWRSAMGDSSRLFVFPHPEKQCLFLYTTQGMIVRLMQLRRAPTIDAMDQQAVRALTASSDASAVDAQGRVRVKDELLAHAGVINKVVLVGTLSRMELWSEEQFDLALPAESTLVDRTFFGTY